MDIRMAVTATALLLGFLLTLGLAVFHRSCSKSRKLLPPGSLGWPVVGEALQFLALSKADRSRDFFEERIQKYGGDIFKTSLFGHPTAVLYSPAGNRFLFSNENKLVQNSWPDSLARLFGNSLLSKVGDDAKVIRKMLLNFLRPEALQKFVSRVDSIVNHHLRTHWFGNPQIKAFPLLKRCLFSVACSLFLSLEEETQQAELYHHFIDLLNGMLRLPFDFPGTLYRKARIGSNHIRRMLQTVIDRRRKDLASGAVSEEQDLLSFLLCNADERGNRLADDDIKDNIMLLLMAGHDTSVITVTLLIKYLALNPACYHQVLQEQLQISQEIEGREEQVMRWDDLKKMKYSWSAAQETLRLHPPAGGTWRKAIVDISYGGFTIPKGWKLFWTTNSTHRKEEYFKDPHIFEPSRFEGDGPSAYTFVPFGGGPRMCPGNEFARMVILVLVHNIVNNFEWQLIDPAEKVSVDPMPTPSNGLPIKLQPRSAPEAHLS
uniref:Cytochrome P450 n=1 Tax=Araucaria cunninghamii TaxID=56994 RepID=A0A0D6QVB0_ARACU